MCAFLRTIVSSLVVLNSIHVLAQTNPNHNSSGGDLSKILFGDTSNLPPECKQLSKDVIQPLFMDSDCALNQVISDTVPGVDKMTPQVKKICSTTCTDKGKAALKSIAQVPVCGNQPMFGVAVVGAFYYWNQICMESSDDSYCVLDQAKQLQKYNISPQSSLATWPTDVLCTKCSQKQYQLFSFFKSSDVFPGFSKRQYPGSDVDVLRSRCGDDFISKADKDVDFTIPVKEPQQQQVSKSASQRQASLSSQSSTVVVTILAVVVIVFV